MPKIDKTGLETRIGSPNYPAPFRAVCAGRHKTALGNAVGLAQFGVNLTRLEPGAASALRHWHENEDEFVYVLEGEITLIENDGETLLKNADAAMYRAKELGRNTFQFYSQEINTRISQRLGMENSLRGALARDELMLRYQPQINLESGFNPNAISGTGAEGIAQFMPATARGLGINPWDPIQALRAAANLMSSYNKQYGGNYAMALAAYNGGSGTVQNAINACGSNWMNCLPAQSRNYIHVIMGI